MARSLQRILGWAAVGLCALPGLSRADWPRGDEVQVFALLVGQSEGQAGMPRLRYAQRDVEKMRDVLVELGGLEPGRCTVLQDGDTEDLLDAMVSLEAEVGAARASGREALLVFYYSGHARDGFLVLGEDEELPMERLRSWLASSKAQVRVAFLDACQSGALTRQKGGQWMPSLVELEPAEGQVILTSSSADENSQESDDIGGSYFTHYLNSGLRGAADSDGDGQVSLSEVYEYTYSQTVHRTASTRGGTQHPAFGYQLAGRGEIILTRTSGLASGLSFPAELEGTYLVYDLGADRLAAELIKGRGAVQRLALAPGRYLVKKRRAQDLLVGQVELTAGQPVDVRDEDMAPMAFEDDITKGLGVIAEGGFSLRYGLRFGGEMFFDAPSRHDLFYSSLQGGAELAFVDLLARHLTVALDFLAGGGHEDTEVALEDGSRERVGVTFQRYQVGLSLVYGFDWDWFGLFLGPRLTFLVASRSFHEPYHALPAQSFSTLSPGAQAGLAFHVGPVDVWLEGRVHYLYYHLDGDQSLGFGGVYLGLAYRH